ncbi:MAG TPA: hypothetical protein VGX91_01680 [Candidatus Cybelea sp.]|nr:hypothetical protein [Candidatus Cybelea sp.]
MKAPSARGIFGITLAALTLAAMPKVPQPRLAAATIDAAHWPYLPGSVLPLRVEGISIPYHVGVLGPGGLDAGGHAYEIPATATAGTALLVAGNAAGIGARQLRIGGPPDARRPLVLVASYDDGLIVHDARDLSVIGLLATGGVPSDVAVDASGRVAVTDTQGSALTLLQLDPWSVGRVDGVVSADDVDIDGTTHDVFVTDRDWNGTGALTRISASGDVTRVPTGDTAEGLAIDEHRGLVYVANTNDGTVAVVDARTMRLVRRFYAVARVFSLALSDDGSRLFAISNQSADSPFARPGAAVAISLAGARTSVVARSAALAFPIGLALDSASHTLFVSDEQLHEIDVLDARTLRRKHDALPTCAIPWKLTLDGSGERLYVPCAGDNAVDVFDARTLRRMRGAPFATGGYPLAIAVWRG